MEMSHCPQEVFQKSWQTWGARFSHHGGSGMSLGLWGTDGQCNGDSVLLEMGDLP